MKKLAVLGHPIGHSLSPVMHNASIQALGLQDEYVYDKLDVAPEALMARLRQLPDEGYVGVNLTIPLKETAYQNMDSDCIQPCAALLGAVNTVHFSDGRLLGYNTDGYGFMKAVEEAFGPVIRGSRVFLIGCGGAGRAVALTAAQNGVKEFVLSDVDPKRIKNLANELASKTSVKNSDVIGEKEQIKLCFDSDFVIQASPVGMNKEDPSLLPAESFCKGQCVFDLIYMYPETKILSIAKSQGARVANGLGMLLHQGVRSFGIWTGIKADVPAMRNALEKAVY